MGKDFSDSPGFLRKGRPRLFSCGEGAGRACMDDLVVTFWASHNLLDISMGYPHGVS
jgi:hypothetical protein